MTHLLTGCIQTHNDIPILFDQVQHLVKIFLLNGSIKIHLQICRTNEALLLPEAWKHDKRSIRKLLLKMDQKKKKQQQNEKQNIWQIATLIRQTALSSLGKYIQVFFKRNRLRCLPSTAKHLTVWWFYRPLFCIQIHPRYNSAVILVCKVKIRTQIMMLRL